MAKSTKTQVAPKKEEKKQWSELVIKEIMVQKNVTREEAIKILDNPTPHRDTEKEANSK